MKISKLTYIAAGFCLMASSCSDYTPNGIEEVLDLQPVNGLTATIGGAANHDINLNWTLPNEAGVTGTVIYQNAIELTRLDKNTETYTIKGSPLGEEVMYTVKATYENDGLSVGKSVSIALPEETFEGVSNLKSEVDGRTVTLSWVLPTQAHRTGFRVYSEGNEAAAKVLEADATSCELKFQPMDQTVKYYVEAIYDTYYYSPATTVDQKIPYVESKMLYLLPSDAATYQDLTDDDEIAAATWFAAQPNAEFIHPAEIADYDPAIYTVMWINVDREGLPMGWENLPGDIAAPATIDALKAYSAAGGNLYLSTMATQLTVPLEFVPSNMAPTVFNSNPGGDPNPDTWTINAYLGWDYRGGADQGFYDRTEHAIFKGLKFEDLNGYEYPSLPLIGPGVKEDHNCLWDCNLYGKGSERDVVRNFEVTTNSLVLAVWGQVRDHCIAGMVDFFSSPVHGRCVAMGLAAYEWNQNDVKNIYQDNVEKLTENILNYLK